MQNRSTVGPERFVKSFYSGFVIIRQSFALSRIGEREGVRVRVSRCETCGGGVPLMVHGNGVKITPETIPDITKQPEVMEKAAEAGNLLRERLTSGHDRKQVTQKMQQRMTEMMKRSA